MTKSLIFFFAGFAVCLAVTPFFISLAKRTGFGMDEPDDIRKRHQVPVPRTGGAGVALTLAGAAVAALLLRPEIWWDWAPIFCCAGLFFLLGILDDLRGLNAKTKFIAQIAIALLAYAMGLGIDKVSYPGGAWSVDLYGWSLLVTVVWLIAVPNIVNLIDGFDGLAGGLGVFMAATLGVVGLMAEQQPAAWISFALAGALIGFLVFNFPPAKIFLGDGGAYFIGFLIAAISLQNSQKGSVAAVLLVTLVALGLPILDTLFAMIRRTFRGFPLFHADDEHIHHRLEARGFSKRRILLGVYAVCVVLSILGLSIFWSQGRTLPVAAGVVFLMAVFSVRYLRYFTGWSDLQKVFHMTGGRRQLVRYALLQARVLDMEIDRLETADAFWPVYHSVLKRTGFQLEPAAGEEFEEVRINSDGEEPLVLFAPRDPQMPQHWQRIANCFAAVHKKALEKWKENPTDISLPH